MKKANGFYYRQIMLHTNRQPHEVRRHIGRNGTDVAQTSIHIVAPAPKTCCIRVATMCIHKVQRSKDPKPASLR